MKNLHLINCLALLLPLLLICFSSCKKTEEKPQGEKTVEELIIPDNFNFETSQTIELVFQDQVRAGDTARYEVYLYSTQTQTDTLTYSTEENVVVTGETVESTDPINDLVASKVSETGLFNLILSIPSYIMG